MSVSPDVGEALHCEIATMTDFEDHIKALGEVAERVRKQLTLANTDFFEKFLGVQKDLEKALLPVLEAHAQAVKAAQSISIPQFDFPKIVLPQFDLPDLSSYFKETAAIAESFQKVIAPAFDGFQRSLHALPPRTREALLLLGSHGWFMDFEWTMPQLWALKDALLEGDMTEAENELVEHFEGRLDTIEKSLAEKFPHRAHILRAALGAHRRKEYELSIPVLLAQTDGICKEIANRYLFIREKTRTKPEISIYVEQTFADAFKISLLSPLCIILPIGASQKERLPDANLLNRHAVLHGESLTYGTQINSLKAVSLINYVANVLEIDDPVGQTSA
jgi:hypothetical protein